MKKKILVVDDEFYCRNILEVYLTELGYEVLTAEDSSQCIHHLKNNNPDLVLLDIDLADSMNGITILRSIRSNSQIKDLPVILCTALGTESMVEKARTLQANDFLVKPFNLKEVELRIASILKTDE